MMSYDVFYDALPVRQINGCRYYGPREQDAMFTPPQGSELFVARIPPNYPHRQLIQIFSIAGPVYDVRLMMTYMKENKGYAFVRYSDPDMALRALCHIDNYKLPGKYGHLVALFSTDHRTLMLSGCSPTVTRDEVERVFGELDGAELVSVSEEVEVGHASPVFYLLFASHRSAAVVRKSTWKELVPRTWGRWARLDWQPNNEVDQRRRFKIEKKKFLNLKQYNPATMPLRLRNPSENFGVLRSIPSTSNTLVQPPLESMLLDEASNSTTFDFNCLSRFLNTNGGQRNRNSFSLDSENFTTNQRSFRMDEEVSHSVTQSHATENSQNQSVCENPMPIQESFSWAAGAWGGAPLFGQQKEIIRGNWNLDDTNVDQENNSFASSGAWGGLPSPVQNVQRGFFPSRIVWEHLLSF